MSKSRPDLKNDIESIKELIDKLLKTGVTKEIYVTGSRSPLVKKKADQTSDWDLVVVTENKTIFPDLRAWGYHADITNLRKKDLYKRPTAVQIYPEDKRGILKGKSK